MKLLWIVGALLVVPFAVANAQLPRQWDRQVNGVANQDDFGYDIAVDASGNVGITGSVTGFDGVQQLIAAKFNKYGFLMWKQVYSGPGGMDIGFQTTFDSQGNLIVVGDSLGDGTDQDLVVLKYNPAGTLLWVRRYDGPIQGFDGNLWSRALVTDASNNIYVGGSSTGMTSTLDGIALKYSPTGRLLWEARYNGAANSTDYGWALELDSTGNVFLGGDTTSAAGNRDFYLAKINPNTGEFIWSQTFDGAGHGDEGLYDMVVDGSNNVFLVGYSTGVGTLEDIATLKYSNSGSLIWAQTYNSSDNREDIPFGMAVNSLGQVAVTGYSEYRYQSGATTLMYDVDGTLLWSHRFDHSNYYIADDQGIDLRFDSHDRLFVTGASWSGPEVADEAWILEYDSTGAVVWTDTYDGPVHGDEACFAMEIDHQGNVYIGGYSQRGSRHQDLLVIKYGIGPSIWPTSAVAAAAEPPAPLMAPEEPARPSVNTTNAAGQRPMDRLKLTMRQSKWRRR